MQSECPTKKLLVTSSRFNRKIGVYFELESINFLKSGVIFGAEVKVLEVGLEQESEKADSHTSVSHSFIIA